MDTELAMLPGRAPLASGHYDARLRIEQELADFLPGDAELRAIPLNLQRGVRLERSARRLVDLAW